MGMVQCKQCLAVKDIPPGEDPHDHTWCGCCMISHNHGEGNAECAADDSHDCWQGPQAGPKPDGCQVCRPVVHFANSQMRIVDGEMT
jgi:hypothetical protein